MESNLADQKLKIRILHFVTPTLHKYWTEFSKHTLAENHKTTSQAYIFYYGKRTESLEIYS